MYLSRKTFNWSMKRKQLKYNNRIFKNVSYITEEVGYWRKVNSIHKFKTIILLII